MKKIKNIVGQEIKPFVIHKFFSKAREIEISFAPIPDFKKRDDFIEKIMKSSPFQHAA